MGEDELKMMENRLLNNIQEDKHFKVEERKISLPEANMKATADSICLLLVSILNFYHMS